MELLLVTYRTKDHLCLVENFKCHFLQNGGYRKQDRVPLVQMESEGQDGGVSPSKAHCSILLNTKCKFPWG